MIHRGTEKKMLLQKVRVCVRRQLKFSAVLQVTIGLFVLLWQMHNPKIALIEPVNK
jgi:hypothetical protein